MNGSGFLATQFVREGWSLKQLHRLLMGSSVDQQASDVPVELAAAATAVDPENRLLWRMNRRRLEFEAMRDTLLAVSGVKGGTVYGATDEIGYRAVEKPVHVHDLHATILHLLGFDHTRLTFRHAGRDFRLTDVSGNVVQDILA